MLLDGLVEVTTANGRVALVHPGGWFGELALLDGGYRRATVRTLVPSILFVFAERDFTSLLASCPSVATKIRRERGLPHCRPGAGTRGVVPADSGRSDKRPGCELSSVNRSTAESDHPASSPSPQGR